MPGALRTALLDRISEEPERVVDFLAATRILRSSPPQTETLLPTGALRKLLGLPPDGTTDEPEGTHQPAAIVAAILVIVNGRGIAIPDSAWERIRSFAEYGEIESWVRRLATADAVDEFLR